MKVKELIKELSNFDGDLEVCASTMFSDNYMDIEKVAMERLVVGNGHCDICEIKLDDRDFKLNEEAEIWEQNILIKQN